MFTHSGNETDRLLWQPSKTRIAQSNITRFTDQVNAALSLSLANYQQLYDWSLQDNDQFWQQLLHFSSLIVEGNSSPSLVANTAMREARWFPNLKLNYAENLLASRLQGETTVVFKSESGLGSRLSYQQLQEQVSRAAQAMQAMGINQGDRVAAVLPNTPYTLIAMLAATSLGAIWSSCSPDFGIKGIVDRFDQVEPKLLLLVNGYYYNGKWIELTDINRQLQTVLPTVSKFVITPYHESQSVKLESVNTESWQEFLSPYIPKAIEFKQVAFRHPLFIMFSSGTTGKPKCIVHGHGGTLIQHVKEHQLHCDIKPGDKLFYFTTCGWMMWNWLVSALASKAAIYLYDGSPFYPNGKVLFDYAQEEKITHFGTSAKFIDACHKAELAPIQTHDLGSIATILSTGSVLAPESFDYVYKKIKSDVCLSSVSGGTDIIACFAGGNPCLPVYRGELQCRVLGMDVKVFDDEGNSLIGQKGELVCCSPFPSQPIGFWGDDNNEKYYAAYFSRYDDVWCQGDYVELTREGTMIFYGRSDAVLNPGGVRIGTAEIYRQVESLTEIMEAIVVGQNWQNDVRVVLFVRLQAGVELDEALINKIKQQIRTNTTPRHVPAKIVAVADIPRTKSGKIVELAVRNIIHNEPVKNTEALANPEALDLYKNLSELQH
jgi:acetoacetyl-CoA synthetase